MRRLHIVLILSVLGIAALVSSWIYSIEKASREFSALWMSSDLIIIYIHTRDAPPRSWTDLKDVTTVGELDTSYGFSSVQELRTWVHVDFALIGHFVGGTKDANTRGLHFVQPVRGYISEEEVARANRRIVNALRRIRVQK